MNNEMDKGYREFIKAHTYSLKEAGFNSEQIAAILNTSLYCVNYHINRLLEILSITVQEFYNENSQK